jgi:hypothetical protein
MSIFQTVSQNDFRIMNQSTYLNLFSLWELGFLLSFERDILSTPSQVHSTNDWSWFFKSEPAAIWEEYLIQGSVNISTLCQQISNFFQINALLDPHSAIKSLQTLVRPGRWVPNDPQFLRSLWPKSLALLWLNHMTRHGTHFGYNRSVTRISFSSEESFCSTFYSDLWVLTGWLRSYLLGRVAKFWSAHSSMTYYTLHKQSQQSLKIALISLAHWRNPEKGGKLQIYLPFRPGFQLFLKDLRFWHYLPSDFIADPSLHHIEVMRLSKQLKECEKSLNVTVTVVRRLQDPSAEPQLSSPRSCNPVRNRDSSHVSNPLVSLENPCPFVWIDDRTFSIIEAYIGGTIGGLSQNWWERIWNDSVSSTKDRYW